MASSQNNRSSPSPQSKPSNSLPKNQVKVEQSQSKQSVSQTNENALDNNGSATPKTPFTRQPVNKNGRNLAFTQKANEENTNTKETVA